MSTIPFEMIEKRTLLIRGQVVISMLTWPKFTV